MIHRSPMVALLAAFGMLCWCASATRVAAEDDGVVPKSAEVAILRNPGTPSAGGKDADVSVVEYFDYNCSFCKKLNPVLAALLAADSKVSLVYKEWPILSETSKYAAEMALAAGWQGKYPAAHDALMGASHLSSHVQVEALLHAAGVDVATLEKDRETHAADIKALLQRNDAEAGALGIRGTPGMLVGGHIINGVYDVAELQQAVAIARRDRRGQPPGSTTGSKVASGHVSR